jgi:hypothetical protein
MKAFTRSQAFSWYMQRAVQVSDDGFLYFGENRSCITLELPKKPYELVALANSLLPYTESTPFNGALLWLRQWGVWSELVERAGFRVLEAVRNLHGERSSASDAPGYLFDREDELVDLQVSFIQPLLIGWDAFLVPNRGDYIVATSHDETISVLTRTPETHKRLLTELQAWGGSERSDQYFKGTAIPV